MANEDLIKKINDNLNNCNREQLLALWAVLSQFLTKVELETELKGLEKKAVKKPVEVVEEEGFEEDFDEELDDDDDDENFVEEESLLTTENYFDDDDDDEDETFIENSEEDTDDDDFKNINTPLGDSYDFLQKEETEEKATEIVVEMQVEEKVPEVAYVGTGKENKNVNSNKKERLTRFSKTNPDSWRLDTMHLLLDAKKGIQDVIPFDISKLVKFKSLTSENQLNILKCLYKDYNKYFNYVEHLKCEESIELANTENISINGANAWKKSRDAKTKLVNKWLENYLKDL